MRRFLRRSFVAMLGVALFLPGAAVQAETPVVTPAVKAAEATIRKALEEKTTLELDQTPLVDVAQAIAEKHKINVLLDKKALDDAGLGADIPITFTLKDVTLRTALRLMLKEFDLTWVIGDEVLLVTTIDEAGQRLRTQVYDVLDLVLVSADDGYDYDSLIGAIQSSVAPTTWDEVGGPGNIASLHGMLVISQTEQVHEEIAELLAELRRVRKARGDKVAMPAEPPPADPVAVSVKIYRVSVPVAQYAAPTPAIAQEPMTKQGATTISVPDNRYLPDLAAAIPNLVRPETWKAAGGEGVIYSLPADASGAGELLVRQTSEVHAQLQRFLKELGSPYAGFSGTGCGFF